MRFVIRPQRPALTAILTVVLFACLSSAAFAGSLRVLDVSPTSAALSASTPGPDLTFATQALRSVFVLPDDREYELVTPPEKNGASAIGIDAFSGGGIAQAAEDGSGISYLVNGPIGAEPNANTGANQLISWRGATGWQTQELTAPSSVLTGTSPGQGSEFKGFSADLSLAVANLHGNGATEIRDTAGEASQPLAGKFRGGTPDLSDIVLLNSENETLSEWDTLDRQSKPVDVLPGGGGGLAAPAALGWHGENTRHAISNDGSRVIWEAVGTGLFDRDTASEETIQLDESRGGAGSGGGIFRTASADGSHVFFTSKESLTADARTRLISPECDGEGSETFSEDLYEMTISSELPFHGELTDITVESRPSDLAGACVIGTLGSSEDGSSVYLVARGVLASNANARGEAAAPGHNNVYLRHAASTSVPATTTFITSLSEADSGDWTNSSYQQTARVSPNGRFAAFLSLATLTGYDNTDVSTGAPDSEVYLYDADSQRLICASCDPTGGRPEGGSTVPGWTPYRLAEASYQSRYLSDSGRLFFDSADAIVPQDVNGKTDVYEFEPSEDSIEGSDCSPRSPGFDAQIEGCISLISNGTGSENSTFLDASASGNDVFFRTQDRLIPLDTDGSFDVYDAHSCTPAAPCFAAAPPQSPPCATSDACKSAPAPEPRIFGPSGSATFASMGNLTPPVETKPVVKSKAKPLSRAQRLARALKACRKDMHEQKRVACERAARQKYALVKKHKRTTDRGGK